MAKYSLDVKFTRFISIIDWGKKMEKKIYYNGKRYDEQGYDVEGYDKRRFDKPNYRTTR